MIAVMVWHAILHTHHGNTHIIAVGRGRRGEGGEEEEEEEKHADIKSNNPHLTGGEQTHNLDRRMPITARVTLDFLVYRESPINIHFATAILGNRSNK